MLSTLPGTRFWHLQIGSRPLPVTTTVEEDGVIAADMDQGPAFLSPPVPHHVALRFATALGVPPDHLRADLPTQVASTGLRYLLLPVTPEGLAVSHVSVPHLPTMLAEVGADFIYVLDPERPEGRTWDQRGVTEDVATGSAAGPVAEYLIHHGLRRAGQPVYVYQGQHVGRPSRMDVRREGEGSLHVGGLVAPFLAGTIGM